MGAADHPAGRLFERLIALAIAILHHHTPAAAIADALQADCDEVLLDQRAPVR